jgi:hypothetical protein
LRFPVKKFHPLLVAAAGAAALLAVAAPLAADPPPGGKWKAVFSDDFDGKEVDAKKWEKVGDGKRRGAWWLQKNAFLDGKGNLVVRSTLEDGR